MHPCQGAFKTSNGIEFRICHWRFCVAGKLSFKVVDLELKIEYDEWSVSIIVMSNNWRELNDW